MKIERDYGSGGVQLAYEYGYNSDGARVWKRDVRNGQEYRYVCRIGCGGVPMQVYYRAMGELCWNMHEHYLRDCRAFQLLRLRCAERRRFSQGRDTLRAAIARQSLSGFDHDRPIDAIATDIGFYLGFGCIAMMSHPAIGLLLGV